MASLTGHKQQFAMVRSRQRASTVSSVGEAVGGAGRQAMLLSWLQLRQGGQEVLGRGRAQGREPVPGQER